LKDSETIIIPGYKWMGKNRTTNTGGGIGILVRNDISNITSEDPCMKEDNSAETLWIKIRSKTTINIAVTYGPQENHRKEETKRYYKNLTTDTIRQQKEALAIIMGDLNAKLHINRGEYK
jgi:exonuclease III